jgi:SAM-dependent methyltransferase
VSDLNNLASTWEGLAEDDALWAVLTKPGTSGGRWDVEDFFASGVAEIERVLDHAAAIGMTIDLSSRALDFGCGVGRLTQALAGRFAGAQGVDISPTMIRLAREHNRYPNTCDYTVNAGDDLSQFETGTFGFVFSELVLQHMHPRFALSYLAEFMRVLQPGECAVFEVPAEQRPVQLSASTAHHWLAYHYRRQAWLRHGVRRVIARLRGRTGIMEYHLIPEAAVRRCIEAAGGEVVDVRRFHYRTVIDCEYYVRRAVRSN